MLPPVRLHTLVTLAVVRTALGLLALALPLAIMAQTTRLLPLLVAAAPAARATTTLLLGGVALIAITLTPPVLAVAVALTLARMHADGGVRLLASHGVTSAQLVDALRPMLVLATVGMVLAGVVGEPQFARVMRRAVETLAVRGLQGTLRRGGEVEPLPGIVLAAPFGAAGPLDVARVPSDGGVVETLHASHFATGELPGRRLGVQLTGVTVDGVGDLSMRAERMTVSLPRPDPPDDVIAHDLTEGVTVRTLAAARRHAARVLWAVLTYTAGMWAAVLALRPWRSGTASGWRDGMLAAVLPVVGVVLTARLGALAVEAAHSPESVWRALAGVLVGVLVATESAVHIVAPRGRRVL